MLGFLDLWTNPFAHVGRRLNGTAAGTFLVTGPGWSGSVPEGMTRVAVQTDHVWIIGRIMVEGPEDVPAVNALQDGFRMAPLAAWARGERHAPCAMRPRPSTPGSTRRRHAMPRAFSR